MKSKDVIVFHRNGTPGMRFSLSSEAKKKLNRELRDENIRIAEERGLERVIHDKTIRLEVQLTPAQIRRKLRGGKHGKEDN